MADVVAVVEGAPASEEPDEFSAAFEQLSAANEAAKAAPEPVQAVTEPEKPAQAAAEPVEPAPEPQVDPQQATAVASQDKTAEPTAAPAPQRMSDEEIARIAQIASQVQRPQPQPEPQRQAEPQMFSQEDIDFLNNYAQEYPDIARAEALNRRKDILDAVRFVFSEVNKAVAPTQAIAQQLAQRTHMGDLQRLVPDYNVTREQAIEWARQQPDYLQPSYFHVIQQGTPEQVADFTARMRASLGAATPVVNGNGHAAVAASAVQRQTVAVQQETPAQKRALAALAPVATKRSGISSDALEPSDFEGAFERYSAQFDGARR